MNDTSITSFKEFYFKYRKVLWRNGIISKNRIRIRPIHESKTLDFAEVYK